MQKASPKQGVNGDLRLLNIWKPFSFPPLLFSSQHLRRLKNHYRSLQHRELLAHLFQLWGKSPEIQSPNPRPDLCGKRPALRKHAGTERRTARMTLLSVFAYSRSPHTVTVAPSHPLCCHDAQLIKSTDMWRYEHVCCSGWSVGRTGTSLLIDTVMRLQASRNISFMMSSTQWGLCTLSRRSFCILSRNS